MKFQTKNDVPLSDSGVSGANREWNPRRRQRARDIYFQNAAT